MIESATNILLNGIFMAPPTLYNLIINLKNQ